MRKQLFLFLLVLLPMFSLAQERFHSYYIDVYLVADGDTVDKTYLTVKKPYDNLKLAYASENEEVAVEVVEDDNNGKDCNNDIDFLDVFLLIILGAVLVSLLTAWFLI